MRLNISRTSRAASASSRTPTGRAPGAGRCERCSRSSDCSVPRCIHAKANVVSRDERESGLRQSLNFGHTVGHALETVTRYRKFLHGEAVAWGMLAAAQIAGECGKLAEKDMQRIARVIWRLGALPSLQRISPARILRATRADKKSRAGKTLWVLPRRIGEVEFGVEVPEAFARKAIARLPEILAAARKNL